MADQRFGGQAPREPGQSSQILHSAQNDRAIAWFARASGYLHRADPRCPEHRVAHTGKLARAVVLDLALFEATGDATFWQRAVERARFVATRLAPDPEHGAFIYLPGRLDPRNCSNSVIDSGECTGALATLLAHPQATNLPADDQALLEHAVERNAETYLVRNVVEKEITNQRLWGAMGLAAAYCLQPRDTWLTALEASLRRSLGEQHRDGSWPYHPAPAQFGQHAGAGDVSVYYQSRCLAFLITVLNAIPELAERVDGWGAVERGLEFLAAVTAPDGLKPLALEGKRWFWDSPYEAGSNAYDVYALVRGSQRFQRPEWAAIAARCWWQLARHQEKDGGIRAGVRGAADFVCRDFHTADLAWTAQVMGALRDPATEPDPAARPERLRTFPDAGIRSLQGPQRHVLVRFAKAPRNSQFGGAVGGGALAAVWRAEDSSNTFPIEREQALVDANFVLYPLRPARIAAARRFLRANPLGREGRQWLFVARLLVGQRRWVAAFRRLLTGYLRPFLQARNDPATSHWATASEIDVAKHRVEVKVRPAREDGTVPGWAADVLIARTYEIVGCHVHIREALSGGAQAAQIEYLLPERAIDVEIDGAATLTPSRSGRRTITLAPGGRVQTLRISYRI